LNAKVEFRKTNNNRSSPVSKRLLLIYIKKALPRNFCIKRMCMLCLFL